ncbi:MAG: glycoside hydrolase family 13 protein [Muribaculaceae bacterium]|nr:glycoside hydrolase family 13 protein [Muribaculaceae bacterium]
MKFYAFGIMAGVCLSAAAAVNVAKIDPPHWWAGMNESSLQLQVYGTDIKSADVSLAPYPGVSIDSVARLDGSNNYLFVYLYISPQAKPGELKLTFTQGKQKKVVKYELLARREQRGAQGFDASDVLYMVMPDRFADGNPANNIDKTMRYPVGANRQNLNVRHGGDLKGIADHIDYIDTLGVTAVWFNPVLENDMPGGSYHGYSTTDYYRVDPRFGTNDEYTALIASLHDRDIKTVMDMIFNHTGSEHVWKREAPASDWFNFQDNYVQTNYRLSTITDIYASDYDRKLATDGWFVATMPDLNQRNPHLMKYLIQNSIWWIEESQIDGIRMDTYPYADRKAMGDWVDAVLAEYPGFNIVGECWFADPAGEMYWQKGSKVADEQTDTHLPTVMDFAYMIKSRGLAPYTEDTDPWNGLNKIYDHLALDYIYADPMKVLRFLDNHDTERVILEVPENLNSWKQAQTLLLTVPGIPQVYYGTELLMAGDRKLGDGNVRRDMPGGFPNDTVNAFTRKGRTDLQNEAFDFLSKVLNWRKGSKAIAEGTMLHYAPMNGIYLYKRFIPDTEDEVVVILNGRDKDLQVDMSRYEQALKPGAKYRDILTGETIIPFAVDEAERTMNFSPRQILILEPMVE